MKVAIQHTSFGRVQPTVRPREVATFAHTSFQVLPCKASASRAHGVQSGEWNAASWSLSAVDDVMAYFNKAMLNKSCSPSTRLSDIMQTRVMNCGPEETLADLSARAAFSKACGLPVVTDDGTLVGFISKSDMINRRGIKVHEVMSFPPIAARQTDTVATAACLMLKYKVHKLPVVDDTKRCVGLINRTDVFTALAVDSGTDAEMLNIDR